MSARRLTTAQALARLRGWREARGQAPSSIAVEQRTLRRLLPRLGRALGRATRADLERLLAARLAEARPATVARELRSLRALYRLLEAEGATGGDPTRGLCVRPGAARQVLLSEDAVARLLAAASAVAEPRLRGRNAQVREALALRDRAALELLYGLGVRASEACSARVLDLDLACPSLLVARAKGGAWARLPLPAAAVPRLTAYLACARPYLLGLRGDHAQGRLLVTERGRALGPDRLWELVARAARRAKVEAHPHALRRSLATHLVDHGAPLPAVQRLLGHAGLDTTQRYVLVDLGGLRAAVEALESLPVSPGSGPRRASGAGEVAESPAAPSAASRGADDDP